MHKEREREKESSKEREKERETSNTNSNTKTYNRNKYTSALITALFVTIFSISFSRRLAPYFSNSTSTRNTEVHNDGSKNHRLNSKVSLTCHSEAKPKNLNSNNSKHVLTQILHFVQNDNFKNLLKILRSLTMFSFSQHAARTTHNDNTEVHNDGIKTSRENGGRESLGQGRSAFSACGSSGEGPENSNPAAERLGPDMLSKNRELAAGEMLQRNFQSRRDSAACHRLCPGSHEPGSFESPGRVYEHPEKRTQLPELKGVEMERSDLVVFSVNVKGTHEYLYSKRYYGVAVDIYEAMKLVTKKAFDDGWTDIYIDDVTRFDNVAFAPRLSEKAKENESEVEKCQS